jgi:hypothetical protein
MVANRYGSDFQAAPWLDDLRSEVLAFPNGFRDDQVDSISQALEWMSRPRYRPVWFSVPPLGGRPHSERHYPELYHPEL